MASFRSRKSQNTLFWPILLKNKKGQNFQFLAENHGLTSLEKCKWMLFSLKWLVFHLQGHKTLCFGLFFWKTKQDKISSFFTKNHGLTPLEKYQIFVFFKWMFFEFKIAKLLFRSSQNTLYGLFFAEKQTRTKFLIFDQQPWNKKQILP